MAKGAKAKQEVVNKLAAAFGTAYIGEYDKKYYVWANDEGERVQIAISLTCPKNPIEIATTTTDDGDWDFSDSQPKSEKVAVMNAAPAEITQEEVDNLAALMEKLGL